MLRVTEILAGVVRFLGASTVGFFLFAVATLGVHAAMVDDAVEQSATDAALVHTEFDRRVLASLTRRALAASPHLDPREAWSARPALVGVTSTVAPSTYLQPRALAFVRSDTGPVAYARRGILDVLPVFLGALAIVVGFAGFTAAARAPEAMSVHAYAGRVFAALIVLAPLALVWRADIFHARTAQLGGTLVQALFVAGFVAAASRAAARSSGPPTASVAFLSAIQGRVALGIAVREAMVNATGALRSLIPTLAIAAVFVRAKAELSVASVQNNGLALLMVRTVRATSRREQWVNAAILTLAMLLLTAIGELFLREIRRVLSPPLEYLAEDGPA